MRTLAITGMVTVFMISRMTLMLAMRATPPSLRMSEGTRSSAITAQAPAFSAMRACSAVVTSMMTPPLSISARPTFTRHSLEPLVPFALPFTFLLSMFNLLLFNILVKVVNSRTLFRHRCGSFGEMLVSDYHEAAFASGEKVAGRVADFGGAKTVAALFFVLLPFHDNFLINPNG